MRLGLRECFVSLRFRSPNKTDGRFYFPLALTMYEIYPVDRDDAMSRITHLLNVYGVTADKIIFRTLQEGGVAEMHLARCVVSKLQCWPKG